MSEGRGAGTQAASLAIRWPRADLGPAFGNSGDRERPSADRG